MKIYLQPYSNKRKETEGIIISARSTDVLTPMIITSETLFIIQYANYTILSHPLV